MQAEEGSRVRIFHAQQGCATAQARERRPHEPQEGPPAPQRRVHVCKREKDGSILLVLVLGYMPRRLCVYTSRVRPAAVQSRLKQQQLEKIKQA